jgi:hypothetical protein
MEIVGKERGVFLARFSLHVLTTLLVGYTTYYIVAYTSETMVLYMIYGMLAYGFCTKNALCANDKVLAWNPRIYSPVAFRVHTLWGIWTAYYTAICYSLRDVYEYGWYCYLWILPGFAVYIINMFTLYQRLWLQCAWESRAYPSNTVARYDVDSLLILLRRHGNKDQNSSESPIVERNVPKGIPCDMCKRMNCRTYQVRWFSCGCVWACGYCYPTIETYLAKCPYYHNEEGKKIT